MVRVGDYEVTSKPDPEGNTLVRFECECGAALTTSMGVKMANLNIGGQLQVGNKPCPLCSRPLALPSGHYKTDESGMLVRVGDFQAGVTSADDLNKKLN